MADNVTANAGTGGATFAGASLTFSGDTAVVPLNSLGILSGSEGAWTFTLLVGGAGAVTAGVPRTTLASDDPAVVALQIIDDWDETDRAKVNPIVGQAGIAGGAGVVSAATTRVAIATDANTVQITGTVTVGSHAVTNAGTFAVQVDGNALTALQLIDDCIYADDGAWTGDTSKHALVGGIYQSVPQTITDGRTAPILLDSNGKIQVASHAVTNAGTFAVQAVCTNAGTFAVQASQATASNLNATVVGTGTFAVQATCTNAGTFAVQAACTNAGTFAVQVDGNALTALQLIDDCIFTDDVAFTPATSKVAVVGAQADDTATDSVDEGDAGALRMTLDRKLYTVPSPHTAGGCSIFRTLDLDETEEDVKTAAGQVYGVYAFNTTAAILWLKFYNATAANVVVGTTAPVMTLGVPGNNDTDGAGFIIPMPVGVAFDTAICVAATTGVADADTGAPGANALIVQVFYK